MYFARKSPFELPEGHVAGCLTAGVDKIDNGLCLRQIDPAVKKCAKGKFPGVGQSSPQLKEMVEDPPHDHSAAMTMDFNHIFTRVGTRSTHENGHDFVQVFPG